MIRRANFADIPRLVEILQDAHARSPYVGLANIDEREAKALLVNAINRHGRQNIASTFIEVAEAGGVVEGFIIGLLQRLYHIGDRLQATDLFWLATPLVEPADPSKLMRNMIAWAESCPAVVDIQVGVTAALNGDWTRTEKLLRRRGLTPYGGIYRKEVRR